MKGKNKGGYVATQSQRKARNKYNAQNTVTKSVQLNKEIDKDIIKYIEGKKFNTLVKKLIREDIKKT